MSEYYQLTIPPSYIALYVKPVRTKPNVSRETITARDELCEGLVTALTGTASDIKAELHFTEDDVLERIFQGFVGDGSGIDVGEGRGATRLAEFLEWPALNDGGSPE